MAPSFLHLEDEKSSLFLEKLLINGNVESDDENILKELHTFYAALYSTWSTKMSVQIKEFLTSIPSLPKIKQDTTCLVGPITEEEVLTAITHLWPGKSLGSDGLTAEFYKHFADILAPILTKVFNKCFEQSALTNSQRLAIIILLFKKGDSLLLGNYRPISLTNSDYKILTYILTMRLQDYLTDVISVNQTTYMKGCFIGCNIRSVQDMINYFSRYNLSHLVLLLDLRKLLIVLTMNFYFIYWNT